ncbi:MAG TPA: PD-(D/E)XK nuclease superfamily protein [Kofleriaceae bacterium]
MATTSKPPRTIAAKTLRAVATKPVAARSGAAAKPVAGSPGMTGNSYRDLIASYIHHNYAAQGLVVYCEISLGKTVIGKDRCIDVFVVRPTDRKAIAIECKYQDSLGTVDEKIPYALQDLEALWVPGCLVYAGKGWSKGVLHSLEASRLACSCMPDATTLARSKQTRELDHMLAATFGFWDLVLPASKKFKPKP